MKVELISHTPCANVCGIAAKTCVSPWIPDADEDCSKSLALALASGHGSVAEHMTFTFAVSGISRACSHQLVRHRMASFSQQSQRYVGMDRKGFGYVTPASVEDNEFAKDVYGYFMKLSKQVYAQLVDCGVPPEDARYVLPNACSTNLVVTMNARELAHFFGLRCCQRAQWEIRELADRMLGLVRDVAPELFGNAGARCAELGYCPERGGCGKYPPKKDSKS